MSIKLKKLLKNIPHVLVKGSKEIEITGICAHSKRIAPGYLFVAKKGLTHNGSQFIGDAVASGAVAVVTDMYNPFFPHIVQIIAEDVSEVEALLAREYYQHASARLCLVGITGTNGKTTTSYLVKHLLDQMHSPCGLIGTIEWIVGQHVFPSALTTADVITNYKLFHEMATHGCQSCVMEVSSHALDQERVRSIEFDIAVFTNLTQDHLDYHKTMEAYGEAKAKLFASLKPGVKPYAKTAIINADSPFKECMIKKCPASVITYGIDSPCDLRATDIQLSAAGIKCDVHYLGQCYSLSSALIGRFNVYNLLASIAVGIARAYPLSEIIRALKSFNAVQGRLERVENEKGLHIFVDYAHTDDALANVLKTLKEIGKKRVITVFGCGGNRDRTKRPKMGAVAEALSDSVIITSDNPRSEEPTQIITEILAGFTYPTRAHVIPDRKEAIYSAVSLCRPEDILLIAGKGHESYQVFSHSTVPFDDRQIARDACNLRSG